MTNIKNLLKDKLFLDTFRTIKAKPKTYFLTLLFDVLFLGVLYAISTAFGLGSSGLINLITNKVAAAASLVVVLIYLLLGVFVYSFFKYSVIDSIDSMFSKKKTSYKRLAGFFGLNVLIGLAYLIVFFFLNLILSLFPRNAVVYYLALMLLALYLMIFYLHLNLSQLRFFFGSSVRDSFKSSLRAVFRVKNNIRLIGHTLVILLLLNFAEYLIGIPLRGSSYLITYAWVTNILNIAVIYLILAFNRIYLYKLVRR